MTKRNLIGLAILCSVLLSVGACGKKKGDKAGKADKAGMAGKSGGSSGAASLIGKWKLDGKKIVASNEMFSKAPKAAQAKIAAKMSAAMITVTKDTMIMEGMGPKQTDKYKVVEDKGKTVVIESTDDKGKKEKATYTFLSGSEVKIVAEEGGQKMIFFATRQ